MSTTKASNNSYPTKSLDSLFAEISTKYANKKAVTYGNKTITYQQLDIYSDQISRELRQIGVQKEDVIVVALEQSINYIITILAIIKSGGAYLPLDISHPAERQKTIIQEASPKVIITYAEKHGCFKQLNIKQADIENLLSKTGKDHSQQKDCRTKNKPENLAYVMYTSGSTGTPKGVMIEHRNIINLVTNTNYIHIKPKDKIAQISNIAFDASTFEIWGTLLNGANLVIISKNATLDTQTFKYQLLTKNIDIIFLTARLFDKIIEEDITVFRTLKTLIIGGEQLDPAKTALLANNAKYRPQNIINGYGPTESTTFAVTHRIGELKQSIKTVPIGKPIGGLYHYILNKKLQPVATGSTGELYIGGIGVARGYLNRPDLTKKSFIENHIDKNKKRDILYKTADLVHQTPEGLLEFIGRTDNQIKLRGFRIELDEIAYTLKKHKMVSNASVTLEKNEENQYITAYIIPEKKNRINDPELIDNLRDFTATKLPDYMIPSLFMIIDKLPLNANNKFDKKLLPKPQISKERNKLTALEKKIKKAFCAVLGIKNIEKQQNIFYLGANSLVAARIASRISGNINKNITLYDIFNQPTIESLAKEINENKKQPLEQINPQKGIPRNIPVTAQQEQIWFLCKLNDHNRAYNAQFNLNFHGPLDKNILGKSINEIIKRHAILRTTFHNKKGKLIQKVHKEFKLTLDEENLSYLPKKTKKQELNKRIKKELAYDFNIENLPLFKTKLYKISENEYLFLQIEHHFIHDGWSIAIYLRELQIIYNTLLAKRNIRLPSIALQYTNYAIWQRQWLDSKEFEKKLLFWTKTLKDAANTPPLELGDNRPKTQSFKGGRLTQLFPQNLYQKLREFSKKNGVTLFMTLYSAFALLIYRYTEQNKIFIGSAAANRKDQNTESILGMFVNTIVLTSNFHPKLTFKQLLKQTKKMVLLAYAHADVPIESIIKKTLPNRDPSRNPLFQLMFAFHDSPVPTLNFDKLKTELNLLHNDSAKNDINVICIPRSEQLIGSNTQETTEELTLFWEYNKDILNRNFISDMLTSYKEILQQIIQDPEKPATEIPLLTAKQKNRILEQSMGPALHTQPYKNIIDLLQNNNLHLSNKYALANSHRQISYKELDITSNKLANHLIKQKAKKQDKIVLLLKDTIQHIIAMLAILKIGAIYIPLDDRSPSARIKQIIIDTKNEFLLTDYELEPTLENTDTKTINIAKITAQIYSQSTQQPKTTINSNDIASIIYTSGTSGKPKGVMITHGNITSSILARFKYYKKQPKSLLLLLSTAFDSANAEILWTLGAGGTLFLPHTSERQDPDKIWGTIRRRHITHIAFVPSLYEALLNSTAIKNQKLNSLELIILGGETCSRYLVKKHAFTLPTTELYNEYGPTETTVWNTVKQLYDPISRKKHNVTIGSPIAGNQVYISDQQQRLKPTGTVGELCIGGAGVSAGYLNNPNLNSEKFTALPFLSGKNIYRTGDLGKYLSNGEIKLYGRIDKQIKLHGYRIELEEINTIIRSLSFIKQAVTILEQTSLNKNILISYIVCNNNLTSKHTKTDIVNMASEKLKQLLPQYMHPKNIIILEKIPTTMNGKIDYKALPKPTRNTINTKINAPVSEMEKTMLSIWRKILHTKKINTTDNFFHLGGDSITSMELISLARTNNISIQVRDIYQYPTIKSLAKKATWINPATKKLGTKKTTGMAPLSPIQHWFFSENFKNPNHFNQAIVLNLHIRTNQDKLTSIFRRLLEAHSSLRLRFKYTNNKAEQRFITKKENQSQFSIETARLKSPEKEPSPGFKKIASDAQSKINIQQGPLIKSILFDYKQNKQQKLLIIIHHLLIDQVSWRIILNDLEQLLTNNTISTRERSSYKDWSESLMNYRSTQSNKTDYWLKLTKIKQKKLAVDFNKGKSTFGKSKKIGVKIDNAETIKILKKTTKHLDISFYQILAGLLILTIFKTNKSTSTYIALERHGREKIDENIDITNTTGWFTSYFPAQFKVKKSDSYIEQLLHIKNQLKSIPSNGINYGILRNLADDSTSRKLEQIEQPQIAFNYLGNTPTKKNSAYTVNSKYNTLLNNIDPINHRPHLLNISARLEDDKLHMSWLYSINHFQESSIRKIIKTFLGNVNFLIAEIAFRAATEGRPYNIAKSRQNNPIIKLRATGNREPIFCIHPIGGHAHWYYNLATAIDSNHPVYGIENSQTTNSILENRSIEAMASNYLSHILEIQPKGPYYIAGWSFGAFVAHELARQLEETDKKIGAVILFDQHPQIQSSSSINTHITNLLTNYKITNFDNLTKEHHSLAPNLVIEKIINHIETQNIEYKTDAINHITNTLSTLFANHNAMIQHQPKPITSNIFLFMSEETLKQTSNLSCAHSNTFGWQELTSATTEHHIIPGDHYTILQPPNLYTIAEKINSILTSISRHQYGSST